MISLIENEKAIESFLNKVLKPLENDEVYVMLLCARKKYCENISSSEEILSRELIRDNEIPKILRKLKKMGSITDIYTDKNNNIIPSRAMAIYILLDPRSTLKAYGEFNKSINEWITNGLRGEHNPELYRYMDLKLFSAIHKSRSRPIYFIIDIDRKEPIPIPLEIEPYIVWISETHSGYHIILERNNITGSYIHKINMNKKEYPYIEILKEPMTPIPGILQGNFLVKEVNLK